MHLKAKSIFLWLSFFFDKTLTLELKTDTDLSLSEHSKPSPNSLKLQQVKTELDWMTYCFWDPAASVPKPSRRTLNYWYWARYDSIVSFLFLSHLPSSLLLVVWKVMEFVTEQPYWLFKLIQHQQEQTQASRHKFPLMLVDRIYFVRDYFYINIFLFIFYLIM